MAEEESSTQGLATITQTGDYRVLMDGATVSCPATALGGSTYVVGERVTVTIRNPRRPLIEGVEDTILPETVVEGPRTVPPRGSVMAYPFTDAPPGWLLCDGSTHNTADYPYLAAKFGATGSTFTVPDYRNVFLLGSGSRAIGTRGGEERHTLTIAEVPRVTGSIQAHSGFSNFWAPTGAFSASRTVGSYFPPPSQINAAHSIADWTFDNGGGGQSHNNMPPFEVVNYIIKT